MSLLLLLAALLLGAADALVGPLVVGLNKYSHDASICVADARTGEPLLVWAKERLTRRKHDGGDTAATRAFFGRFSLRMASIARAASAQATRA